MPDCATLARMRGDLLAAMKGKDADRVAAIRLLLAPLSNKKIDVGRDLTEDEVTAVLTTEAKKRREAAAAYRDGQRAELAEKEERELAVIAGYLPEQLSDAEVADLVDQAIASSGASKKSEIGKVMGLVMPKVKGRFDGARLKDIVLGKLS